MCQSTIDESKCMLRHIIVKLQNTKTREKTQKEKKKRRGQNQCIRNWNGPRLLNSNTKLKKAREHCVYHSEKKTVYKLEFCISQDGFDYAAVTDNSKILDATCASQFSRYLSSQILHPFPWQKREHDKLVSSSLKNSIRK